MTLTTEQAAKTLADVLHQLSGPDLQGPAVFDCADMLAHVLDDGPLLRYLARRGLVWESECRVGPQWWNGDEAAPRGES